MKVTIEIDCTPAEAREFFGLPDVRPMQLALIKRLEEKMAAGLEALSPDALFQKWFAFDAKFSERFQDLFANFLGGVVKRPEQ
jgi:Family of unknown function (DUF6489)